ncbi:MAG: substrate-binding domain-containing protein [Pseudomonadota bacterium]
MNGMILRLLFVILVFVAAQTALANDQRFVLATTTSTENSGLLDVLVERFHASSGITVDVVAVGTGQALALGRRGDAAALLTHDRIGEEAFVKSGHGIDRRHVMHNDFVLVGPAGDPAKIVAAQNVTQAMIRIAQTQTTFLSRGDDSGTHRKEIRLWNEALLDQTAFDSWYRETGAGMGQTLLTATEMSAYTLTDRGTWISFARKGDLVILVQEEPPLLNPYSSILVSHSALSRAERDAAKKWHEWISGPDGRAAINSFTIDDQQLFFAADPAS